LLTEKGALARDLVLDPGFLAYRFDFNSESIGFLPIERDEIRRVSALQRELIEPGRHLIEVPLAEVTDLVRAPPWNMARNPPRFIFHTAFCASTFLSRCLDVEGATLPLREPQILLDAANAKRLAWKSGSTDLDYRHLPLLALTLLQKHSTATERLVIKPINSVNNIIPELLQATGSTKSLMLYTDVRNFVLSTLRKGEGGKQTVRSMFDLIRCDFPQLVNLQLTHTIHMTDLRVAMTLWRLQVEQATKLIQQFHRDGSMASLYGEKLVDDAPAVLHATNNFLGLGIPSKKIDSIVGGDARSRDAKHLDQSFSKQKRDERYARLEEFLGDDLTDGLAWLVRNNPGTRLHPDLGGALPL
jgi:hypothetical protein